MKKLIMFAALALAPMLAACAPPEPIGAVVGTVDDKALYVAEAAYNVPAHAYVTADSKGELPASVKATVKPLLTDAFAALKVARCAHAWLSPATTNLTAEEKAACPVTARSATAFFAAKAEVEGKGEKAAALLPKRTLPDSDVR